ncbi:MAG: hypothetical protein KDA93_03350 [Planctomycetaceae bacterium]|nr:hypothetical protein [Planctomycetaceae bacterium]
MFRPLVGVLLTLCVLAAVFLAWTRMVSVAHAADEAIGIADAAVPTVAQADPFSQPTASRWTNRKSEIPQRMSIPITFHSDDHDRNQLLANYIRLAARMAERWGDEELERRMVELTAELKTQDTAAEKELDAAIETLKSVLEMHPGTPAAEQSQRALEAIEGDGAEPAADDTIDLF